MEIKDIKIRNAYSDGNDLTLVYKENGKRKKLKLPDFQWYCVIRTSDWKEYKKKLEYSKCIDHAEINGSYTKLYADKEEGWSTSQANTLVKVLREYEIETFESDLHSAKRFMVDNEIQVSDEYDILYFDIETDDTNRRIEIGKERILSFGAIDNEGREFYFDDEDEKTLLQKAIRLMKKYDVVAGWNTDDFDLPYIFGKNERDEQGNVVHIEGRAEKLKIPPIKRHTLAKIDMLRRARKLFKEDASLKSYSLENVSQHFLGRGKSKFEGKIIDLYKNDRAKFKEYNMNDVYLLKELDEKTGMIDLIAKECALSKTLIRDFAGVYVSTVLDSMILREAHKAGIYCPSRRYNEEEVDYVGGLVFDPKIGLHKNVYVFDFRSLYPSIIMTSNIGFDTVEHHINPEIGSENTVKNPGTGILFRKDRESIVASVVRKLVEERQSYKAERLRLVAEGKMHTPEYEQARANEIIVKELSNSVYGIMGNQGLRYYSLEIAESITKTGHYLLRFTKEFFEGIEGCNVIYGDTDSVFVSSDSELDIDTVLNLYHQELETKLKEQFNIEKSYIYLKYEKLFESMILVGKKYYAGKVVNIEGKTVNEFIVKGLDLVKKATLPISLESQRKIIDMILEGKTLEDLKLYVSLIFEKVKTHNFSFDEIKISTSLGRDINDYKQLNAPHVKLARHIMKEKGELELKEIEYVVLNNEAPKDSIDGLCLRENYKGDFDRVFYWNQRIWPPMKRILETVFPGEDWSKQEIKVHRTRLKVDKNQLTLF